MDESLASSYRLVSHDGPCSIVLCLCSMHKCEPGLPMYRDYDHHYHHHQHCHHHHHRSLDPHKFQVKSQPFIGHPHWFTKNDKKVTKLAISNYIKPLLSKHLKRTIHSIFTPHQIDKSDMIRIIGQRSVENVITLQAYSAVAILLK